MNILIEKVTPKERAEIIRKLLWCEVAVVVARSDSSVHSTSCSKWADEVLEAFDKRFPRKG